MHHKFGMRQNETNGKRFAHEATGAWVYDGSGFQYKTIRGYREPSRLWLTVEELGTDLYRHPFDIRVFIRNARRRYLNG